MCRLLAVFLLFAPAAHAAAVAEFLASVGVNTHLDATTSSYGRVATVIDQLRFIGVSRLRDRVVGPDDLAPYRRVASAGMRFDLIVMDPPPEALPGLRAMAAALDLIEGPNEVNVTEVRFGGRRGPSAAVALQKDLYARVKADRVLARVPVLAFSVAQGGNFAAYGNVARYADRTSVHAYAEFGVPPYWMLQPVIHSVVHAPGRPPIVTEIGNYTMADNQTGVSESVQAKWVLDTLLDDFSHGIEATYIYQLEDGVPDPSGSDSEAHYGLFAYDGRPKLAATALHNLSVVLRAGAVTASGEPDEASVSGLGDGGFHILLAKAPGVADAVLWAEPPIWDRAAGRETAAPKMAATVKLPHPARTIRVFDPLRGTDAVASVENAAGIDVDVTDHPVIVEITR